MPTAIETANATRSAGVADTNTHVPIAAPARRAATRATPVAPSTAAEPSAARRATAPRVPTAAMMASVSVNARAHARLPGAPARAPSPPAPLSTRPADAAAATFHHS